MEKIKKVLKETIVTIMVYIIVMSNNVIYPYLDKKDSLRVPAGEEQTYKRLRVVIETYEEEEILDVIFDGSGIFPKVLRELEELLKTPGVLKGIAKYLNIEKLVHIKFIAERKVSNQRIEYIREAGILQFYLPEKQTKTPASAKIALNNLLNSNGFNIDTYIERIRVQKILARRERERKAEMTKKLDSIYEDVTKNIRNADSFFRAYVANKKPSDLDLFRRAVDRIIESALPLRGLMLSGAEEVMLPKFFSVFHSILNIPGGPFTEEESKAIKREVEFLIGSCAPDGWKDDQTRQLIAEIQPLGLKAFSENSILAVQSSPKTEMNSAMHGNRKLEDAFNFNLEFLAYHRGLRILRTAYGVYSGGLFIGVSAGLGPLLTGASAAHEVAHAMMEATLSKSQLAEELSTGLHEITTEAIFMLSFLRQNGLDSLNQSKMFGLSLTAYSRLLKAYYSGRDLAGKYRNPSILFTELEKDIQEQAAQYPKSREEFYHLFGSALAGVAINAIEAIIDEYGIKDAIDKETFFKLSYKYVYKFGSSKGSYLERSDKSLAEIRRLVEDIYSKPNAYNRETSKSI